MRLATLAGSRARYSAQQVIDALRHTKGLVSLAAKRLRCDPETIHNYCKRNPSVQQAKVDARGELLDVAELTVWDAIQRGDVQAAISVLRMLGKDRGYGERHEVTGQDGGPVQHAHIHLWEERLQAAHQALASRRLARPELREGQGERPVDDPAESV